MKAVKIKLAGRERYLAFTGEAMFQIRDEYTGTAELQIPRRAIAQLAPSLRSWLSRGSLPVVT